MPDRTQRSCRAAARTLSMTKCTARTSSTDMTLAYWMARAVARSMLSTSTKATWRGSARASTARSAAPSPRIAASLR